MVPAAVELPADAGATPSPGDGKRDGSELAAVRALVAHGPRVDRVLAALDECGVLPRFVRKTLRHALLQSLGSGKAAVEKALDRAAMAAALPWRTREPVRFDPAHLKQVLDRTHGGLDRVKTRLVDVLAASPQTRGALTVEAPRRGKGVETESSALVVFPRTSLAAARVPCFCGPRGTGKTSLAVAVAEALGRPHVRVMLDKGSTEHLIRGQEGQAPGRRSSSSNCSRFAKKAAGSSVEVWTIGSAGVADRIEMAATAPIMRGDKVEELIKVYDEFARTERHVLDGLSDRTEGPTILSSADFDLYLDSPSYKRLVDSVSDLADEERVDLLALGWLGAGRFNANWPRNLEHAYEMAEMLDNRHVAGYGRNWQAGYDRLKRLMQARGWPALDTRS